MKPKRAPSPVWEEITCDLGEDVTREEALTFTRLLNRAEGQAFLWRISESLVALRRHTKRRKPPELAAPVVDPSRLPFLLTVKEVAPLLRTTEEGIYTRVSRGQLTGVDGLLREGTKILFHRDRLLMSLERSGAGARGARR